MMSDHNDDEYEPEREALILSSLCEEMSELSKKLSRSGYLVSASSLIHNAALLFDYAEEEARAADTSSAYMHARDAHSALTAARDELQRARSAEDEDE